MIWIPSFARKLIISPLVRAHLRGVREITDSSAKAGPRKRLRAVVPVLSTIAITSLVGMGLFGQDGAIGKIMSVLFFTMAVGLLLRVMPRFVRFQRGRCENDWKGRR